MIWIWLALVAIFIVAEAATAQLITIWFAIGAFFSFVIAFFTESLPVQIAVFAVVSAIALFLTRPVVRKFTEAKKVPTNADMYIGEQGICIEDIDNIEGKGLVKVKGSVWTARVANGSEGIKNGDMVNVERIEGVKLIVSKIN